MKNLNFADRQTETWIKTHWLGLARPSQRMAIVRSLTYWLNSTHGLAPTSDAPARRKDLQVKETQR